MFTGTAAEVAAAGPTVLGTARAGMLRGGMYGGGFAALDAMKRDHDHSLRSYLRSTFGIPETDEDKLAPSPWETPKPGGKQGALPFGTWQPAAAYAAGIPAPEVKGSADLNVSVQVEPSDSFISRIVQAVRNEINVFGPSPGSGAGTAGSTGLSMPEAGPSP
jgi:hypothetical protein